MNNTLLSDYFRRFQYIQFQERINNLDFSIELRYNHNHDQKGRFCSGGGGKMSASEKSTDTQNDLTSSQNSGNIEERPYEIKKSREKRLEIINRGVAEEYPVFSYDTEKNKFPSYSRNIPKEKGFYDVTTHGADTFVDFFGENIDAYTLANIIRNRKDYVKGTNIRLLSCSTGSTENTGNCFAQLLANELGICVKAPTKKIYVFENGNFIVGKRNNGEMKLFYPRN